jgi:hypothetical protein
MTKKSHTIIRSRLSLLRYTKKLLLNVSIFLKFRLPVHLPEQQNVLFSLNNINEALDLAATRHTMLTAWFRLNQVCQRARKFLYVEIPQHYTWNASERMWCARKRPAAKVIARIYNISPRQQELFFLRTLLLHVRGARNYKDMRTYNHVVYSDFQTACIERGLITDDQVWVRTMREAVGHQVPAQLRHLFVQIFVTNDLTYPTRLWEEFKSDLAEDFVRQMGNSEHAQQRCLAELELLFNMFGRSCALYGFSPDLLNANSTPILYQFVRGGLSDGSQLSTSQNRDIAVHNIPLLNAQQRIVFDTITRAALNTDQAANNCFFVDGNAGTGKTFLLSVDSLYQNLIMIRK